MHISAEVWQEVMVTGATSRGTQTEEESDDLRTTQIHASPQEVRLWSVVYFCVCVCVRACVRVRVRVYVCAHAHGCSCQYMSVYTYIHMYIRSCVYQTQSLPPMRNTQMSPEGVLCVSNMPVCMHAYVRSCTDKEADQSFL